MCVQVLSGQVVCNKLCVSKLCVSKLCVFVCKLCGSKLYEQVV